MKTRVNHLPIFVPPSLASLPPPPKSASADRRGTSRSPRRTHRGRERSTSAVLTARTSLIFEKARSACTCTRTAGWSVRGQWTSACNSGQSCPILLGIGLGWSTHPSLQEPGKKSPRVGFRSPVGGGQFHHRDSLQESFENIFEMGLITLIRNQFAEA